MSDHSQTYPASNKRRKLNLPGSEFDLHKDGIFGSPALDISAMPYSFFRSLPDTHKFALLRATRNIVGPLVVLDRCNWDKVAEEFEKILSDVKRCERTTISSKIRADVRPSTGRVLKAT